MVICIISQAVTLQVIVELRLSISISGYFSFTNVEIFESDTLISSNGFTCFDYLFVKCVISLLGKNYLAKDLLGEYIFAIVL